MKLDIYNIGGEKTGRSAELSEDVFGIEPSSHAVYLDVKRYLAHQRQGTSKSKERGEIKGSTRKIKKQKGTGTARAGSIKSGVFRGGGRMFGPKPRNYFLKLNKKVKQLARKSALSNRMKEDRVIVIEDFTYDRPLTKEYVKMLNNLNIEGKKVLHILGDYDKTVYLSNRNIPITEVTTVDELNTYSIVNANTILIAESSIEKINKF